MPNKKSRKLRLPSISDIQVIRAGFPHSFTVEFQDQSERYYVVRVGAQNKDHAISRLQEKFGQFLKIVKITKLNREGKKDDALHKVGRGLLFIHNKLGEMG